MAIDLMEVENRPFRASRDTAVMTFETLGPSPISLELRRHPYDLRVELKPPSPLKSLKRLGTASIFWK
jgi:hypothetical protein